MLVPFCHIFSLSCLCNGVWATYCDREQRAPAVHTTQCCGHQECLPPTAGAAGIRVATNDTKRSRCTRQGSQAVAHDSWTRCPLIVGTFVYSRAHRELCRERASIAHAMVGVVHYTPVPRPLCEQVACRHTR